jgi:hypothetical protein
MTAPAIACATQWSKQVPIWGRNILVIDRHSPSHCGHEEAAAVRRRRRRDNLHQLVRKTQSMPKNTLRSRGLHALLAQDHRVHMLGVVMWMLRFT